MANLDAKERKKLLQELLKGTNLQATIEQLDKELEILQEQAKWHKEIREGIENVNELLKDRRSFENAEVDLLKNILNIREKQYQIEKEAGANQTRLDQLKKENEAYFKLLKKTEQHLENIQNIAEVTESLLSTTLGLRENWKKTFSGTVVKSFMSVFSSAKKEMDEIGNIKGPDRIIDKFIRLKDLSSGIKKSFIEVGAGLIEGILPILEPGKILASLLDKIVESTIFYNTKLDTLTASLSKATGVGRQYMSTVIELTSTFQDGGQFLAQFGAGVDRISESLGALIESSSMFTALAKTQQMEFVATAAQLENVGISAQTTAKNFDVMTRGLGLIPKEASDLAKQMAKVAIKLQMPPKVLAEGFEQALSSLGAWGKQAPEIFMKVAAASKRTGVDIQSLLGLVNQFDTFEGAAEAAGRLNALLGGDFIQSVDLLYASEEERIALMQESIVQSGLYWDELDRFEKKAIAAALGIQDMNMANKLFSQGAKGYDRVADSLAMAGISQGELNEVLKSGSALWDKLVLIIEKFAIALRPVLEGLHGVADFMLGLSNEALILSTALAGIASLIVSGPLVRGLFSLKKRLFELVKPTKDITKSTLEDSEAIKKEADIAKLKGTIIDQLTDSETKVGKAVKASGKQHLKQTSIMNQSTFAAAKKRMATAALVASIGALAAGIGIAALGLSQLVKEMGKSKDSALNLIIGLGSLTTAIVVLLGTIATLGTSLAPLTVPMLGISAVLIGFGASFYLVGKSVESFGTGLEKIGKTVKEFSSDFKTNLGNLGSAISSIVQLAKEFDDVGLLVGTKMKSVGEGLTSLSAGMKDFAKAPVDFSSVFDQLDVDDGIKLGKFIDAIDDNMGWFASDTLTDVGTGLKSLHDGLQGWSKISTDVDFMMKDKNKFKILAQEIGNGLNEMDIILTKGLNVDLDSIQKVGSSLQNLQEGIRGFAFREEDIEALNKNFRSLSTTIGEGFKSMKSNIHMSGAEFLGKIGLAMKNLGEGVNILSFSTAQNFDPLRFHQFFDILENVLKDGQEIFKKGLIFLPVL